MTLYFFVSWAVFWCAFGVWCTMALHVFSVLGESRVSSFPWFMEFFSSHEGWRNHSKALSDVSLRGRSASIFFVAGEKYKFSVYQLGNTSDPSSIEW